MHPTVAASVGRINVKPPRHDLPFPLFKTMLVDQAGCLNGRNFRFNCSLYIILYYNTLYIIPPFILYPLTYYTPLQYCIYTTVYLRIIPPTLTLHLHIIVLTKKIILPPAYRQLTFNQLFLRWKKLYIIFTLAAFSYPFLSRAYPRAQAKQ